MKSARACTKFWVALPQCEAVVRAKMHSGNILFVDLGFGRNCHSRKHMTNQPIITDCSS